MHGDALPCAADGTLLRECLEDPLLSKYSVREKGGCG